jgi:uncharacterized protein (TIGR00297 family)
MLEIMAACFTLAVVTWKSDILSPSGSFIAFIIAALIWSLNGFNWIFLMLSFMMIAYIGTKWKYEWKRENGFEESLTGSRDVENVLGNGISPTFFAVLGNPIAFTGAISTALSDTLASEIGVFSEKAKLITTFEPVKAGTEGAVSILGIVSSLLGSTIISILGYFIFSINPIAILLGGFLGCQVDSFLGATLERKGYISNSMVNLAATFSGGLIALFVASM